MKKMPSHLLTEWIAFFKLEEEEIEISKLPKEAIQGEQAIRAKREHGRR